MNKKALTEADICDQFITPAIVDAGWEPQTQIRREYSFTDGRVQFRGRNITTRGKRQRADYVLFYESNLPLAVVEAKDNNHALGAGMQQGIAYAKALDVPFVFSSNGDGFLFHDLTGQSQAVEQSLGLDAFPSPDELWRRYRAWKGFDDQAEKLARFPYHEDTSGKVPRYYQRVAVQRTIEAVARGDRRILLAMATGVGKTLTAFQIIWRLWKAGAVERVLMLVDRNVLIKQTRNGDFKPFGEAMTWVRNRQAEKQFEIYLALYQAVSGTEEEANIYKQFSPDFFDLVLIDECHRGSAREDSAWREILDYFEPAIQLGMTATPKETKAVSTLTYFGEPLYTYSLKQGIDDGFLAPYKVVRIGLDKDLLGWRPPKGMRDDLGQEIEDREYNQKDMDRVLVLNERTKRVAEKVVEYMLATDPYGKAIVFCQDIDHASRMRTALINEVAVHMPKEADNTANFVVQITGDNDEGKRKLDYFQKVDERYPVIATTSKLLTTGVDVKTCKFIVLDQNINSMIEFKQIVGRGTRILEEAGKTWFTIMDFKGATRLFADPDWDGEPVVVYEPGPDDPVEPPEPPEEPEEWDGEDPDHPGFDEEGNPLPPIPPPPPPPPPPPGTKYIVSGVQVSVVAERVMYYGNDGKLITESLTDYTRKAVRKKYATLDDFFRSWSEAERKQAILEELQEQGLMLEELQDKVGKDFGAFDLICHVVYDRTPLTRRERAENVRKRDVFTKYGEQARAVLNALLDKYADEGVMSVEDMGVLRVHPLAGMGTPVELVNRFGGAEGYKAAVRELQSALYSTAA